MLGGAAGAGSGRSRPPWPIPDSTTPQQLEGVNRIGGSVYSLFPSQAQKAQTGSFHKVSESHFSATSLGAFGVPTPPPGSPYQPMQLELLSKSFSAHQVNHLVVDSQKIEETKKQYITADSTTANEGQRQMLEAVTSVMQPLTIKTENSGRKSCNNYFIDSPRKFATEGSGCSRTNPISWSVQGVSGVQVQVKREPLLDVGHGIVKMEQNSPNTRPQEGQTNSNVPVSMNNGNIPVGIAVARQRLAAGNAGLLAAALGASKDVSTRHEESTTAAMTVGVAPMGGTLLHCEERTTNQISAGWPMATAAPPALAPPPTLWQYPAPGMPMESMLMSSPAPAPQPTTGGLQLVRDPTTGALLLIQDPSTMPLVWGQYAAPPPPLLFPPQPPQLQLLPGELLTSSHTLHHHTTRLVALAPQGQQDKRSKPLPMHTLIKIEPDTEKLPPPQAQQFQPDPVAPLLATHVFYQPQPNYLQIQQAEPIQAQAIQVCRSQATSPVSCLTPPPETMQPAQKDASNQTDAHTDDDDGGSPNRADDGFTACVGVASSLADEDSIDSTIVSDHNTCSSQQAVDSETSTRDIGTAVSPTQVEKSLDPVERDEENSSSNDLFIDSESQNSSPNSENKAVPVAVAERSVDVSGLELLSNSIEQFEIRSSATPPVIDSQFQTKTNNNVVCKQESERKVETPNYEYRTEKPTKGSAFDGLGLLSAIAEQRFMEEVEDISEKKKNLDELDEYHTKALAIRRSSYDAAISASKFEKIRRRHEERRNSDDKRLREDGEDKVIRQKEDKVRSKNEHRDRIKSLDENERRKSRDERRSRDRKKSRDERRSKDERRKRRERRSAEELKTETPECGGELLESYKRVAACRCGVSKCEHVPSAQQLVSALERDMRERLDQLQRAFDERRRQLHELVPTENDSSSESRSGSSKKRKVGRPRKVSSPDSTETIVAKKPKTQSGLVSYLIANKAIRSDPCTSRVRPKLKAEPKVKPESDEEEEEEEEEPQPIYTAEALQEARERNRKHTEKIALKLRENKRRCTLTEAHLEKETRVLTAMGGLFYAGKLTPVQAPDVYAITLDGERGNKPHIMSREETLRDAILEVTPTSVRELPPGTRMCAYWSQQYRCLYPGTVADSSDTEEKFVPVEFDDGDSGRIAIEDIRLLEPNYPVVDYDPNPLLTLGKRKRRISAMSVEEKKVGIETVQSGAFEVSYTSELNTDKRSSSEERRRHKKKRHKERSDDDHKKKKKKHKCCDEHCKHRKKHKHRRKHRKKHKHRDSEDKELGLDVESPETNEDEEDESGELKDSGIGMEVDLDTPADTAESKKKHKKRSNSSSSDSGGGVSSAMAAFLPGTALWKWSGLARKGNKRGRKFFYKAIERGQEKINVGDAAVFLSTGRPDRPYIGRVVALWAGRGSSMFVKVKWYYHPEETAGCPNSLLYPGGLFESPHTDENDVQTISHKCEVLPLAQYKERLGDEPERYKMVYDNNDVYYLAGNYDPTKPSLKMEPDIPVNNVDD